MSTQGNTQLEIEIARLDSADLPFVRRTWYESRNEAGRSSNGAERHGQPRHGNEKNVRRSAMPWRVFKAKEGRIIDALLQHEDVVILGAYSNQPVVHTRQRPNPAAPGDDKPFIIERPVVGWIAFAPGRVPTLFYVYVRRSVGAQECRRLGIASALLEAAELGPRVVYCFHGPKLRRGHSTEEALLQLANRRGVSATYVPVEEFVR